MHALPSLMHFLAVLIVLTPPLIACAAEADAARVDFVNKVENDAQLVSASGASATAVVGAAVHMKDELRTGATGRMQVTFRDNTVLTLGENASVLIDRYVYDPDKGIGETVLQATKGAFRFATGRIKELKAKTIPSRPRSPISRCAAPNSGADRSMPNMGCCCSKEKSPSPTRRKRDAVRARTGHRYRLAPPL